jgi:CRISPR-associated endonuclease/helicase Cas3
VHLARPFAETLTTLAERYQSIGAAHPLPARWEITQLSATPDATEDVGEEPRPPQPQDRTFRLGDDDRNPAKAPVLVQRLTASKEAVFKSVAIRSKDPQRADATFAAAAADEVQRMLGQPFHHTVAVIVNRVDRARVTYQEIRARCGEDVLVNLLTGRMRSPERDRLVDTLARALCTGRPREESDGKRVVVATQCIEAGADFDFDGLVTECASVDALLQRFGRLDRGGWMTKNGSPAAAVVLARSTDVAPDAVDPVYGDALRRTWAALEPRSPVNFGPSDFPEDLRRDRTLRPIAESSPALLDTHLDAWVQTRPAPTPDPDPSLWLHGLGGETRDVNVVWRSDLDAKLLTPPEDGGRADDLQRYEQWIAGIRSIVTAIPPATTEAISLPIAAVRRWFLGEPSKGMADIEGPVEMESDDQTDDRGTPRFDGPTPILLWNGDRSEVLLPSRAGFDRISPGMTIIVPSEYGGIGDHHSWDPAAAGAVSDIAELSQLRLRRRPVLRILPGVIPAGVELPVTDDPEVSDHERVGAWIAAQAEVLDDHPWSNGPLSDPARRATIKALAGTGPGTGLKPGSRVESIDILGVRRGFVVTGPRLTDYEFGNLTLDSSHDPDDPDRLEVTDAGTDADTSDPELSSFTAVAAALTTHLRGVREWARCLATNCGLPADLVADLALAGELHDLGKADPRFQAILRAGGVPQELQGQLLAKSAIPSNDFKARRSAEQRSGYPAGTRHELMSLALIDDVEPFRRRAHDWDLVRHLVASHHGWCRPFPPATLDDEPVEVTVDHDGIRLEGKSNHDLARLDHGVPERFWILVRRYGWFRLAWLEAILRLADQNRSEAEQRGHAS